MENTPTTALELAKANGLGPIAYTRVTAEADDGRYIVAILALDGDVTIWLADVAAQTIEAPVSAGRLGIRRTLKGTFTGTRAAYDAVYDALFARKSEELAR